MSREQRRGKITKRGSRPVRNLELGHYLIVTDTEKTEENYLMGLKDSIPKNYKDKIAIRVIKTKTENLIRKAKDLLAQEAQYRELWIVFDRDKVTNFDAIIQQAVAEGINVGWSNPCIEIWFHAYFGAMPSSNDSVSCCSMFRRKFEELTAMEYEKSSGNIYRILNNYGDEEKAISIAEKKLASQEKVYCKPSDMNSTTTLHQLVKEIKDKVK